MANRLVKLVRDDITEERMGRVVYQRMTDEEYYMQLRRKLVEEATEWALEPSPEELADLLEILMACAWYWHELTLNQVLAVARERVEDAGGFWEGNGMYGVH